MRIVSLIPSATEILCALGLEEQIVGVTHECDWPASVRCKPHVTASRIAGGCDSAEIDRQVRSQLDGGDSLYSLDAEALRDLRPDLIVSQTLCDVCAVADFEVQKAIRPLPNAPRVLYLEPTRLQDVFDSIERVAAAAGVSQRARGVILSLRQRLAQLRIDDAESPDVSLAGPESGRIAVNVQVGRGDAAGGGRPRVVVLEWLDPLYSCGHWTPELVELAGGIEPLAQAGERSRRIEPQELAAADPDLILVACCGFDVVRTMHDVPKLLNNPLLASLRAVRERNVYVTDGSAYFSRPGPRLVDSAEILAHALRPRRHALPEGVPAAVRV